MKISKCFMIIISVFCFLSLVSLAWSQPAKEVVQGTITKIEGDKVTIKDESGKLRTIKVQDVGSLKTDRYKVGNRVKIEEGKISMPSGPTPKPAEQKGEMPVPPQPSEKGKRGEMPVPPPRPSEKGKRGEMPVPPQPSEKGKRGEMPVPPPRPSEKGKGGEMPVPPPQPSEERK